MQQTFDPTSSKSFVTHAHAITLQPRPFFFTQARAQAMKPLETNRTLIFPYNFGRQEDALDPTLGPEDIKLDQLAEAELKVEDWLEGLGPPPAPAPKRLFGRQEDAPDSTLSLKDIKLDPLADAVLKVEDWLAGLGPPPPPKRLLMEMVMVAVPKNFDRNAYKKFDE